MAGYIFNLNNELSLKKSIENGVYSTNLSSPMNNNWKIHHEGTFTDFLSMKEGDNVYFFINRKIYGIGELVNLGLDCKLLNYPDADVPNEPDFNRIKDKMLLNESESNINNRCICTFKPSPYFFQSGIDMDDVLASNPKSFRILRAFWKVSFIKIDHEENKALKDIILKRNEEYLTYPNDNIFKYDCLIHQNISRRLTDSYKMNSENILKYSSSKEVIRHEMAIEAHIADVISHNDESVFGYWDYITHQVIASPFKPIDYMDKMDIFGYRFIPGFDTISQYLVIEIKKGSATIEAVDQVMKYVDWINQEYAHGEYNMIHAYIVAYDFNEDVINYKNTICKRNYIKGRRPTLSDTWSNVKLIKYRYNAILNKLDFKEIT
ncbi:endonuclease NucS [Cytobacillus spongiae]|uniref:endonuclease NucS n=1 Tax=Cytobacillus spongiae TaxID=2901381 RepID=UPI001F3DB632|nr:endonuclease NucS [Cytobacillus spongiae]UII57618.1 endonuclease NucS [Cytobacillus spongiae]